VTRGSFEWSTGRPLYYCSSPFKSHDPVIFHSQHNGEHRALKVRHFPVLAEQNWLVLNLVAAARLELSRGQQKAGK